MKPDDIRPVGPALLSGRSLTRSLMWPRRVLGRRVGKRQPYKIDEWTKSGMTPHPDPKLQILDPIP